MLTLHLHVGPNQSFSDLLNVWKDNLAFKDSGGLATDMKTYYSNAFISRCQITR